MNQQRSSFTRAIVDPAKRLRGLLPDIRLDNMPKCLLRAVQRKAVVVVQPVILKQAFELHQLGDNGVAIHGPPRRGHALRVRSKKHALLIGRLAWPNFIVLKFVRARLILVTKPAQARLQYGISAVVSEAAGSFGLFS
jgi:hypothetical protein